MTHQITAIRYFGLKIQFWPVVLISMLALKIVLSVALKQGETGSNVWQCLLLSVHSSGDVVFRCQCFEKQA